MGWTQYVHGVAEACFASLALSGHAARYDTGICR